MRKSLPHPCDLMRPSRNAARPRAARRQRRGEKLYHVEGFEQRVLLAGYGFSQIADMGSNSTGVVPQSMLVADAAGNWYGTASGGGAYGGGTVFEIAKGSNTLTALASFDGADGATPMSSVTFDSAGNLYGTTEYGGAYNDGVVYEIPKGSNTIIPLVSFNALDGIYPTAGLAIDAKGDLFGTTTQGGSTYGTGTIFEVPSGGGALSIVAPFKDLFTSGPVVFDSSGNLYGSCEQGVFVVPQGSHTINLLASGSGLQPPQGNLVFDSSGNLYGTAGGSSSQLGTVFELVKRGTTLTALASFPNGYAASSAGIAIDAAGNLYCASEIGGPANGGAVFELAKGSSTLTVLGSLNTTTGTTPMAGVAVDSTGNLFGTASAGGTNGAGTVFELAKGSGTVTPLASFDQINGANPIGPVVMDSAGNIYGTTTLNTSSKPYVRSVIYEIVNGSGTATPLAFFPTNETVNSGLTMDPAGNLYGTSNRVFELAKGSDTITTVASLFGTTAPSGGVVLDAAGNLYGTTPTGGANRDGTIVEIVKGSGVVTTLATFDGTNGSDPQGGLILDSAGNIYGTAGNVFELPKGSSTILTIASFSGTIGSPQALCFDAAGNLYGAAAAGTGPDLFGAVFEIVRGSGTVTTLASFDANDGSQPETAVTIDPAGNVFGTTYSGGPDGSTGYGTVFEVAKGSGTITDLVQFSLVNGGGGRPLSPLLLDSAGNLYGTTLIGGPGGQGIVFELSPLQRINTINMSFSAGAVTLSRDLDGVDIDWAGRNTAGYVPATDPAGLTINGDSINDAITLDYSHGNPLPNTVNLNGTFTVSGMDQNPLAGVTLALSRNTTVYLSDLRSPDQLVNVQAYLRNAYNGGTWTGTPNSTLGVIVSPDAVANPGEFAIGYADSADANSPDPVLNTVEIKPTILGDTNLDGSVNLADLLTLTRNFGKGTSWDQGDFNYDGSVNLSDFTALTRNFGKTLVVNPLIVTSTADDGSLGTLRYAISHSNPGDTITFDPAVFAPGTTHALTLKGSQLELTHNLTIQGPGSANLSISGNNTSRIFQIDPSVTA